MVKKHDKWSFRYIYLHICHAHDKHVRLHKITQVPPKQHNSEPQASAWLYIGNAWKQLPNARLLHQSERLSSVAQPCRIITLEAMTACKWINEVTVGAWVESGHPRHQNAGSRLDMANICDPTPILIRHVLGGADKGQPYGSKQKFNQQASGTPGHHRHPHCCYRNHPENMDR